MKRKFIAYLRSDGELAIEKEFITGENCVFRELQDGKAYCNVWGRRVREKGCYCYFAVEK